MSAPAETDSEVVVLARLKLQTALAEAEARKAEAEARKAEVRMAEIVEAKAIREIAEAEAKAIRESESFINGGEIPFFFSLDSGNSPHPNSSPHYCPLDHHSQCYFLLLH
jgi:hypothetical protein